MPWNGGGSSAAANSAQQQQQQSQTSNTRHQQQQQLQKQQQQKLHSTNVIPNQCVQVPGTSSGPYASRVGGGGELPEAIYRQIRQVDQQPSTLNSAKGVLQGFSARVLDRTEYKSGGHLNDVRVVQLVEIIKKPGQSLGLYLREGNGIDQFTGVFVSRFGEQSELERCGDICCPGDQILAVNNVPVKEMGIDDVVLMLSIPRRLLLRTSFLRAQREQQANRQQQQRLTAERSVNEQQRPVVVFQKSTDSDRRDSESSGAGILSKPASTAASWLGKRVRQQQKQKQQQQELTQIGGDATITTTYSPQKQQQQPIRHRQYPQNFATTTTTSSQQQQQSKPPNHQHFPQSAVVGPSTSSAVSFLPQQLPSAPPPSSLLIATSSAATVPIVATAGPNATVAQTARILPPPRAQPIQPLFQHSPLSISAASAAIPPLPPNFSSPSSSTCPYTQRHPAAYASATLDSSRRWQRHPSASAPIQRRQQQRVFGVECGGGDGSSSSVVCTQTAALSPIQSLYHHHHHPLHPHQSPSTVIGGFSNTFSQQQMPPAPSMPYQQQTAKNFFVDATSASSTTAPFFMKPLLPLDSYKSNSLPRRTVQSAFAGEMSTPQQNPLQRTVRWRNDFAANAAFPFYTNHQNSTLGATSKKLPSTTIGCAFPPSSPQQQQQQKNRCTRGAFSDVDVCFGTRRARHPLLPNGSVDTGTGVSDGRTVADIFSAQEYRNWASEDEDIGGHQLHRSRWSNFGAAVPAGSSSIRSNSLPSKALLANHLNSTTGSPKISIQKQQMQQQMMMAAAAEGMSPAEKADILDRLHVSPLVNRRVPLRAAGPGFDVDRLNGGGGGGGGGSLLSGMLIITIVEGRNLKVPDRVHSNQLYCVIEINEMHRARTGISTPEQHYRWAERFDIDVLDAGDVSFFVYAWHPQLRHRFCHKGEIRLMDVLLVDGFSASRVFSLSLEPRGQLLLKIAFEDLSRCFARIQKQVTAPPLSSSPPSFSSSAVFGQPLGVLLKRGQGASEVPLVLKRLLGEIERRGVDTPGLYFLCGATERKDYLRAQFDENARDVDISERPVPDVNLLTCLVKDFLRELAEPLVPGNIYAMLLDASGVMPPNDREGNQKLVMRIVDCLATANKNSLVLLIEHLRKLLGSEPHNGLTMQRLTNIFGPLIFCTSNPAHHISKQPIEDGKIQRAAGTTTTATTVASYQSSVPVDPLSAQQASQALRLLLAHWPQTTTTSNE